jgi:outer membrane protein assembly factor BamB
MMWLKKHGLFFLVIVFTFLLFTGWENPTAFSAASDWPQFQKDEFKSGQISVKTPVLSPRPAWSKFIFRQGSLGIQNTPVVSGGTVYVFAGNRLVAMEKKTGETLWEKDLGAHGNLQIPTPAIGAGKVFVATFDGYLMAFDAQSGAELWSKKVSERGFQCPVTYHEGKIFIGEGGTGGETNSYYCLDEDGVVKWVYTAQTAGYLWCGAAVVGNFLVFGNVDGVLTSVYKDTGVPADILDLREAARISFAQDRPGRIRASVTYQNGYLYTTSEAGADAGYLWKIGLDLNNGRFLNEGFSTPIGFSTSTPVVYAGRIYVGQGEHGYPGSLVCLSEANGQILWSCPVEQGVKSSPALLVADTGVYIYFTTAKNDGFLYCLDEEGRLVWKYNPPDEGYIIQGVAATEGMVFLGTSGGYLYCFAEEEEWPSFQRNIQNSGRSPSPAPIEEPGVAWQVFTHYTSTHGIDHSPVIANGKVVVVDVDEYAWAFDVITGKVLWSTKLTGGLRFNLSTPAYGEGKFFVAASTGHIYALDENSGQIIWSGKLTHGTGQKEELSTQVLYHEGKVYVGSWEGVYYCLDASGEEGAPKILWQYVTNGAFEWWSGPVVIGDYLLFGDSNSVLVSVYKDSGVKVDEINLSIHYNLVAGKIRSAVTCNSKTKRIYLTSSGSGNGYLYALGFDPLTGEFNPDSGWYTSIGGYTSSTPAVHAGQVYVCSGSFFKQGGLYCLRETDGDLLWKNEFTGYGSEASPAISIQNGKAYIYITTDCAKGAVYCFDEGGNMKWEFIPDHPEYVLAGVALADNKVFFVNDAGYLYALGSYVACDVNCDGQVNLLDMVIIGQHFGQTGNPGWMRTDVNKDGVINVLDMVLVGQHWTG